MAGPDAHERLNTRRECGAGPGTLTASAQEKASQCGARSHGCACVPPAFAYACAAVEGMGCGVMCPVCLEEVRGGEMVRQLPLCGHVFHVGCIDMWLHSHRTCPMCRCVLSPPPPTTVADKASEEPVEEAPGSSSEHEALPPL